MRFWLEKPPVVDLYGGRYSPSIFSGLKASVAIDQTIAGDLDALEKYTK